LGLDRHGAIYHLGPTSQRIGRFFPSGHRGLRLKVIPTHARHFDSVGIDVRIVD